MRPYPTAIKASEAWLRRAKANGTARVLGGGWWQIGSSRPVQGHHALSAWLLRRGLLLQVNDGFVIAA